MNTDTRNLENIIEVHQTERKDEVNKFLSLGWILLNIHTTDYGHPVERHQSTCFTIGWNKENGEVLRPVVEKSDYSLWSE